VISAIAICFSLFQLYTAIFGVLDAQIQRSIHLSFGMALVFLLYPSRGSWSRTKLHPLDVVLAIVAACVPLYVVVNYQELVLRAGTVTPADLVVGAIGVLFVLEAARRVVGLPIVLVASVFVSLRVYWALFGRIYQLSSSRSWPIKGVGLKTVGIPPVLYYRGDFGIPLGVSSTFIFLFILFGAYLEKNRNGQALY